MSNFLSKRAYNIEHVFEFLGPNIPPPQTRLLSTYNIEHVFDFLGQKLEFWPIINVDLDIKVTLLGTYNIDHVFDV